MGTLINVLCPAGNGWQNERNSVALIVSGINEICTGTLVMNTCGNNIPYLLTANHCLNSSVSNWVFQFQTWSTDCNTNIGWREDVQFNGCQLRANNEATDFALVELNQTPLVNSGLTYSGWTRDPNPAITTTGIHHPSGDLMKICHDFQSPVSVSWFGGASNHWRAIFDQGIVQHGSSGSTLYDENHRIIGQLHGNQNNICNIGDNNCFCNIQIPSIGEYGRFDISWTGGGTNSTRLSNWLDPGNTGATTTNTTNINQLTQAIGTLTISGNPTICSGTATFTLNNNGTAYTGNVSWSSSNPGIASITASGNPATLTKTGNGQVTITATISQCGSTFVKTLALVAGAPIIGANSPLLKPWTGNSSSYNDVCNYQNTYTNMPVTGASSVTWSRIAASPSNTNWSQVGNNLNFYFWAVGQTAVFRIVAANSCGSASYDFGFRSISCGGGGGGCRQYIVSPNPAKDALKLEVPNIPPPCDYRNGQAKNKNLKQPLIRAIKLYDLVGNVKLYQKTKGVKQATLNISGLLPGTYFIEISDKDYKEKQQVIIQ